MDYNEAAENLKVKQIKKIRQQNEEIEQLNGNCANMEFLIKKLDLEDKIKELGIKPNSNLLSEEECEALRNKMVNPGK